MAASGKNAKRRYHTPGVVNDNLARKLDSAALERQLETSGQLDFDQQYRRRKATEAELIARHHFLGCIDGRSGGDIRVLRHNIKGHGIAVGGDDTGDDEQQ